MMKNAERCERAVRKRGDPYDRGRPSYEVRCNAEAVGMYRSVWLCARCAGDKAFAIKFHEGTDAEFRGKVACEVPHIILRAADRAPGAKRATKPHLKYAAILEGCT